MLQLLLRLLFPASHLSDADQGVLCKLQDHSPIVLEREELEKIGIVSIDRLIAAQSYDASPVLKTLLWKWKYKHMTTLGEELCSLVVPACRLLNEDVVLCPVPLHWTRRFARGFNQAEVLAQHVAHLSGCQMQCLLRRVRSTGYQSHRSRAERLVAMRDAFAVVQNVPRHVVLVDDVVTTGSTLEACASALKRAGVEKVEAVVVARG